MRPPGDTSSPPHSHLAVDATGHRGHSMRPMLSVPTLELNLHGKDLSYLPTQSSPSTAALAPAVQSAASGRRHADARLGPASAARRGGYGGLGGPVAPSYALRRDILFFSASGADMCAIGCHVYAPGNTGSRAKREAAAGSRGPRGRESAHTPIRPTRAVTKSKSQPPALPLPIPTVAVPFPGRGQPGRPDGPDRGCTRASSFICVLFRSGHSKAPAFFQTFFLLTAHRSALAVVC